MIQYKQADLLLVLDNNQVNILIHQENCEGLNRFASIANLIHKKFPELTNKHVLHCNGLYKEIFDKLLGSYIIYNVNTNDDNNINNKLICNLYSQYYRGSPSDRYFNTIRHGVKCELPDDDEYRKEALINSLKLLFNHIVDNISIYKLSGLHIGLPLIASGLASNKKLKSNMNDLEYFKTYIYHIVEYAYNHYIKEYCNKHNIPCSLTICYL